MTQEKYLKESAEATRAALSDDRLADALWVVDSMLDEEHQEPLAFKFGYGDKVTMEMPCGWQ